MKTTMIILAMSLVTSFAQAQTPNPTVVADKTSVDSACSAEAQTAGCGGETVGHGLMKCVKAYRKAHPDFKLSSSCKQAVEKLRSDKKAVKSTK